MIFEPRTITDKTGESIILRNADLNDAKDLICYLKTVAAETPYLIREPSEVTLSLEQEQKFIQGAKESDRELMLIATLNGKHIGNCSLMSIGSYNRYRHRCEIAIALYQEYCGRGIGKIMLETVLETAAQLGYEQAELEVIAENENAIKLYETLGFKQYGRFPDNMKYSDGQYSDAYWMMKKL